MKTSKEMQLKIIDKMRENVESGFSIVKDVQYDSRGTWYDKVNFDFDFGNYSYRVKPETITINSVEISKPLNRSDIADNTLYYCVDDDIFLYKSRSGARVLERGVRFVYKTKEEAIEASKALFGIED